MKEGIERWIKKTSKWLRMNKIRLKKKESDINARNINKHKKKWRKKRSSQQQVRKRRQKNGNIIIKQNKTKQKIFILKKKHEKKKKKDKRCELKRNNKKTKRIQRTTIIENISHQHKKKIYEKDKQTLRGKKDA